MTDFKTYNDLYQKYKNTILFNKNLILSGIAAFFAGAVFTLFFQHVFISCFNFILPKEGSAAREEDIISCLSASDIE